MLYCDSYNVKVSKWWYVYKKAVTVQELLRLQRTSWRGVILRIRSRGK
nr:MAG TPA: hypothetical protein [Caudoviricetes sp.]DAX21435.1 MAG TPA: hypothetical protein [Caudoviricetes sp.]DAX70078.1 MAG TPA: hypothetical protein [Caudoviricetes sp.]